MYRQIQHYRDNLSLSLNSALPTIELPDTGLISFILLRFNGTQTGTTPFQAVSTAKWRIVDFLSDIVLRVNGSTDVYHLPGDIAQYEAFLAQGITAFDLIREYSNASQRCDILIPMGDYMWDESRYLDLSQCSTPEIIINNALASTQWASCNVDVWIGWFRDYAARGTAEFYKREVWKQWATLQNDTNYSQLPSGLPIKRIILQPRPPRTTGGEDAVHINDLMYNLKLTYKNKVLSIFDADWIELARQNYIELGYEQIVHGSGYHMNGYYFDVGLGEVRGAAAVAGARGGAVATIDLTRQGDEDYPTQRVYSYQADQQFDYIMRGCGYHNCAAFMYGLPWMTEAPLDASNTGYGPVELEIKTRDSASAVAGVNKIALVRPTTMSRISA